MIIATTASQKEVCLSPPFFLCLSGKKMFNFLTVVHRLLFSVSLVTLQINVSQTLLLVTHLASKKDHKTSNHYSCNIQGPDDGYLKLKIYNLFIINHQQLKFFLYLHSYILY